MGHGPAPDDGLMLVQGPLVIDMSRPKWGLLPRLETGSLQEAHLPDIRRLRLWLRARIQVPTRPDWYFVKLHCHGATGKALLEEPMVRLHEGLAAWAERGPDCHVHYVTAREMYNLIRAAESEWQGSVASARDFELVSPWHDAEVEPARSCEAARNPVSSARVTALAVDRQALDQAQPRIVPPLNPAPRVT